MIDDVRHVVPTDFWRKHLSPAMRDRKFSAKVNGTQLTFYVLCKVDSQLSPRDLVKLKENLYALELAKDKTNFVSVIHGFLIDSIYEKQIAGMGKTLKLE